MAKYLSNRQRNLKIGVSSYTEDTQVLEVTGGTCISGYVGIGTTNPTSKLHVVGDANVTGTITSTDYNTLSDKRYKKNIENIPNPLDKILQLNGVTFDWKNGEGSSAGLIAQEIESVLPQLINGDNPKTVNYNGVIGLLVEAVKEQQLQIQHLTKQLEVIKLKL